MAINSGGNVGIGTASPGVKLEVVQNQATYSYFDHYNTTANGGIVWRQIYRNIANTGNATIDFAKLIGGGFALNNTDTNAANFTSFAVGASERMRITSAGTLLLGTTAAQTGSKVQVRANYSGGEFFSAYCALPSGTSGGGGLTMGAIDIDNSQIASGSEYYSAGLHYAFGTTASNIAQISGAISFFTNSGLTAASTFTPTERMRISAAGYLEFPNSTFSRPGSTGQYIVGAANGGFYQQDGTNYYTVTTSGGSTSDATLKKDVQQLENALAKICAVRGVSFEFIEQPLSTSDCGTQIGVIAQEIEAQFPEIVVTHENGTKAVRYDRLVAPLIEAIKELTARVAQLEGN
jgi:hypothetical protein